MAKGSGRSTPGLEVQIRAVVGALRFVPEQEILRSQSLFPAVWAKRKGFTSQKIELTC